MSFYNRRRYGTINLTAPSNETTVKLQKLFTAGGNIQATKGVHGETINISIDDIRNRLRNLYKVSDKPISSLKHQNLEDFNTLKGYAITLYDTESYPLFRSEVKKVFGKLKNVKHGTVGAFFVGCMTKPTKVVNGENNSDAFPIYYANKNKDGSYNFVKLNDGTNNEQVIVYISGKSGKKFKGFSPSEKAKLKSHGAKRINVVRLTEEEDEELYNGFQDLETVDTRNNQSWASNNILYIIIGILVIIGIIALLIYLFKRSKTTSTVGYIGTSTPAITGVAAVPLIETTPATTTLVSPAQTYSVPPASPTITNIPIVSNNITSIPPVSGTVALTPVIEG